MASSINRATLLGNLGRDPEVRYTQGGQAVASFSIATSESWTDKKTNEKKEKTEWHRIVAWGKLAELCGQYLAKGRKVYVEGRIQTREWNDKEGKKNYTTEIVADQVVFLNGREDGAGGSRPRPAGDDFGPPPTGFDGGHDNFAAPAANSPTPASGGFGGSGFGGGKPSDDDIPF